MTNRKFSKIFKFRVSIILLSLIISSSLFGQLMAPTNLRCEYKTNPLGIDVEIPRLSWHVNNSRRSAVQSAYQIVVASSEEFLSKDESDIWNSGKVESDQSQHVDYSGSKLQSRKTYYWKVKTWDNNGSASAFSETANWEMGILSENEWQANWIGNEFIEEKKEDENKWQWKEWFWHPSEIGINKSVYFRKKVSIPANKKVTSALMRLTADNKFTAYINDTKLGSGSSWQKIYDFDITDKLKKENIVAIEAANTAGNICGLLFSIKINFDDGSEIYIGADKTTKDWKTTNIEY